MTNKAKIGLFFGGMSFEHEVSIRSMKSIALALDKQKFEPVLFPISKSGQLYKASEITLFDQINSIDEVISVLELASFGDIQAASLDCVFSTMHGGLGENGSYQGLFEILQIPYVGPHVLGSSIAMDKDTTKRLLEHAGLNVVPYKTLKKHQYKDENLGALGFPCFIKAASLGSSIGVFKVANIEEAQLAALKVFEMDTKLLIEKAMIAREVEVAILGFEKLEASLAGEIVPHHEFYSYEAKYLDEYGASLLVPAPHVDHEKLKNLAIQACEVLDIDGMARVDFFITNTGEYYINEINTLPGFTSISMYPKLFDITGITYSDLITRLIDIAIARFEKNSRLQKTLYANLLA
jgi:D-alanine-D-alanine ligase